MSSDGPPKAVPVKLESVAQLERELGSRRGALVQLQRDRDGEQERLKQARAKYEALEREIRTLNDSIASKNQKLFGLASEVDWLLRVQERVQQRARELARGAGQSTGADPTPKRSSSREPLVVEVGLKGETNFYVGFSQNISEGGLFVATFDSRPQGDRFLIEFKLPGQSKSMQCMVEVAWVSEYRDDPGAGDTNPGMGLRFIGLDEEHRAAISEFINTREPLFYPEFDDLP